MIKVTKDVFGNEVDIGDIVYPFQDDPKGYMTGISEEGGLNKFYEVIEIDTDDTLKGEPYPDAFGPSFWMALPSLVRVVKGEDKDKFTPSDLIGIARSLIESDGKSTGREEALIDYAPLEFTLIIKGEKSKKTKKFEVSHVKSVKTAPEGLLANERQIKVKLNIPLSMFQNDIYAVEATVEREPRGDMPEIVGATGTW